MSSQEQKQRRISNIKLLNSDVGEPTQNAMRIYQAKYDHPNQILKTTSTVQ